MQLLDMRPDHIVLVQRILRQHVPSAEVWAFGSRAKWLARDTSDLDLCIRAPVALSFEQMGTLREAFEESDLPYKVDVVDWTTTSESFRKIIERDRVVVQEGGRVKGGDTTAWVAISLDELTEEETPITYGVVKPGGEGDVPFVRGGDIAGGRVLIDQLRTISRDVSQQYRRTLLCGGEILVSLVGNPGQIAIAPASLAGANIARQVGLVRLKPGVDTRFVSYFLQSHVGQTLLGAQSLGSVQQVINLRDLKTVKVTLPPLPEQKAIAHILGTLDDKIELNRRMNATLEAMARALFQSWFVDFDPVRAKMEGRPPGVLGDATGVTFPDSLQDSEFGPIPFGWKFSKLKDLTLKIGSGATPRGGSEVYVNEGVALIRSQNIYDHEFHWQGLAYLTDKSATELKSVEVMCDDVLLNITGDSILRTCVVDPAVLPARVNQHVAIIRATQGVPSRYLHLYLVQSSMKSFLMGMSAGATRHAITKGYLESIEVLHPAAPVLSMFEKLTAPWFEKINANRTQSRTLSTLRDTLLPKLLSGELSVAATHTESLSVQSTSKGG